MAPTMLERDIIISIHPQHVENIAKRVKNHEFRNYLIPATVKRFYIYETSPASSIRYIATISPGKRPGEICDPSGLLNNEFDRGELNGSAKYGYEIWKLEELPTPYTLSDLKQKGWLNGAPQKYCFIKPSMKEALRAVPMRLLFDATTPDGDAQEGHVDEPQVEATDDVTAPSRPTRPPKQSKQTPAGIRKADKRKIVSAGKQASLEHWLSA